MANFTHYKFTHYLDGGWSIETSLQLAGGPHGSAAQVRLRGRLVKDEMIVVAHVRDHAYSPATIDEQIEAFTGEFEGLVGWVPVPRPLFLPGEQ